MYEIRRLNLTATTFKVQVDIIGFTSIYVLAVSYIAIDPTFPHHLNSFDNVPINYGTTLVKKIYYFKVNYTTASTSIQYFSNTINYTQQASGRKYTKFTYPLSGNKILFYVCSLYIYTK